MRMWPSVDVTLWFLYFNRICELCNIHLCNASIIVCVNIQNANIHCIIFIGNDVFPSQMPLLHVIVIFTLSVTYIY